ncbi:phosphate/phosphite/phosphonate ABC transporter substrate-binding protein [Brunnivagina elsteri]|uniref:Phosphonate ABC transporter substrate-binding protein n=1 Tax=Brunnivagina elsteri CCALA 953 TaxID=987040 RepID=A0A2A2TIB6_9CYAN|nr:PhnD/SsuA/transferrin family substrate-binding protein [Calothrix elsteri]PAX53472.1 phosphonate ABC transporter substrate-binding protein [Calothrix elsteri CCALA 953]
MTSLFSRRSFILQMLFLMAACEAQKTSTKQLELVVGVVKYGDATKIIEKFSRFRTYLGEKTQTVVQLEPTFNENAAIERIKHQSWSLIFAPPGLAALAKSNYKYDPIFPLEIDINSRAILIVHKDSKLQEIKDLQSKVIALGTPGSAAGYYFPLYNLYGLTLKEVLFAPTPKTILEWVSQKKVEAGALSLEEFNLYRTQFPNTDFRILFTDPKIVPAGSILIGENVDRTQKDLIHKYLREASPVLIQELGYVPNGKIPDYSHMISVIQRVAPLDKLLHSQPVRLF